MRLPIVGAVKGGHGIPGMRPKKTKGIHPVMGLGIPEGHAELFAERERKKASAPTKSVGAAA
jgi:hypothetical protein